MTSFRLRIRAIPRDRLPADEEVGERLAGMVRGALAVGAAAPAIVVLRERVLEAVDPRPAVAHGVPLPWLLAGMATSHTVVGGRAEAVGLAGRLDARKDGRAFPIATVFLEWPDNRWWHWQVSLDEHGRPIDGTEQVRCAVRGDPMPDGLGRWWAAARRHPVELRLTALSDPRDGGVEH